MRYSPHPQVANVDIFPDDFYVGDVYLDTQPTYRQWIAGEALRLCNASFWLSRGATDTQADYPMMKVSIRGAGDVTRTRQP